MDSQEANQRIEAFEKRFGNPHLNLACHLAFPMELTPDLAYSLWHHFQCDVYGRTIGSCWTDVSDVLLCFCNEVGHELYKMPIATRNQLLRQLQVSDNFGKQRFRELYDFLLLYVDPYHKDNNSDVQDFAQAQRLTALAYVYPHEATKEIASVFEKVFSQDTSELFRVASIVKILGEPLANASESQNLLIYAESLEKLAHDDIETAAEQLRELIGQDDRIQVAGVKLSVPSKILRFIEESRINIPISNSSRSEYIPPDAKNIDSSGYVGGHFSTLRTKITDVELLKKSLRDLGISVRTDADVRGYSGQRVRSVGRTHTFLYNLRAGLASGLED
jgi:hypothetical protein